MSKTIQVGSIIRAKSFHYESYKIINCQPATGLLYLVNNFLSGHVRVKGRNNGQYPYNYKEMLHNIFGVANNAIEVCSNTIRAANSNLTTVDIRPETNPNYVADRICLSLQMKPLTVGIVTKTRGKFSDF